MQQPPVEAPPLTPADPRFRAYWLEHTAAEAAAAGVSQSVVCKDAVHVPLELGPY